METGGHTYPPARAKLGLWHGAPAQRTTGYEPVEGWVARAAFEIPSVPDFSSPLFPDLARLDDAGRSKRVGERQDQFLAAIHSLGPKSAVSVRYVYSRPAGGAGRIRLFLIGRSYEENREAALRGADRFRDLAQRTFPNDYQLHDLPRQDENSVLELEGIASLAEILKCEQLLPAWHDTAVCGFSFYYLPVPFTPADNDMVKFCWALINDTRCRRVIVDICLIPTQPLTETERFELGRWIGICERWGREQHVQMGGGLFSDPRPVEVAADPHAQEARKAYTELAQRYGSSQARSFLYAFRVLWDEEEAPQEIASALASFALVPKSGHQVSLVTRNHPAFQRALNAARLCYVTPAVCNDDIWRNPAELETLRRLHRMVDVKEASGFFRFPIAGRNGCPGIPTDTPGSRPGEPTSGRIGIKIGSFAEGYRVTSEEAVFAPADLAKHCLIVGTPGSGKTTLCFSLLTQLWEDHGVPFIVLEPAKTEYRALGALPSVQKELLIFTVGNERISPFRFNPFEVLDGVNVSEHISALNACFAGAFSLWDPLPMILDEAVRAIYLDKGWSEYGVGGDDPSLEAPTMEDLYFKVLEIAAGKSYRGEFAGTLRGALETRIGALLRGPTGRCLNVRHSIPVEILMRRPVILELDSLNDEEKALLMMFLLTVVREYAKSKRKSGAPLSHVVLVEEAHNVIGRGASQAHGEHRANPKEVAVRFFTRMLAEMRALGEGIMIVDQLPTAIAPEAVKNTNIKVMHRLVSADDREELGKAMNFDDGHLHQAGMLAPGQSLVFLEGWSRSRLTIQPNFKEQSSVAVPPDDQAVADWMKGLQEKDETRAAFMPYALCPNVCRVCNPRVREKSERLAEQKRPFVNQALAKDKGLACSQLGSAWSHFSEDLEMPEGDKIQGWCAYVHFREKIFKRIKET